MKRYLAILMVLTLNSCFYEVTKESNYSVNEICECYTKQNISDIDERLDSCIENFNEFLTQLSNSNYDQKKVEELGKMGLEKIVDQLTKTCDSYRSMFIDKSSTTFTFDDVSKAENQILNQNDVVIDTIELAKAYLTKNDIEKSLSLLDEFTAKNPKADFAYWMKSFCYYKSNNINKAVGTIDKGIELSGNENMIQFLKIYRNVLMPKLIDENDEITLTISKDKKLIE